MEKRPKWFAFTTIFYRKWQQNKSDSKCNTKLSQQCFSILPETDEQVQIYVYYVHWVPQIVGI